MKHFPRGLAVALVLVALATPAFALAAVNPEFGYSVDLPVGWVEADGSDPEHIGFLSPNSDAMIQIIALDPGTGSDGLEIARVMFDEVDGEGEPEAFEYQGREAALSELAFTTGGLDVQGYLVTINDRAADYAILAFAAMESYEVAHDHLLSAIDSFSIGEKSRVYPGPVSQYFYPFPAPDERATSVPFLDRSLPFAVDPGAEESAKVVVDRESRILEPYGALDEEVAHDAWRRYFRMIYRDNYMRLAPVAGEVEAILEADGLPRVDYPHELLAWLQGFDYERTGGLSDFQPPVSCLANASGDCDSLAMTYVIILHHLGFDAIMMASNVHAHALAAVDAQGGGARFPFEDKQWLVAELTADVGLGQIDQRMADPEGWIGVRMRLQALEGGDEDADEDADAER
ncbi:MAG: hypothetical protein ACOC6J_08485 [Spirochaetota bacterium]